MGACRRSILSRQVHRSRLQTRNQLRHLLDDPLTKIVTKEGQVTFYFQTDSFGYSLPAKVTCAFYVVFMKTASGGGAGMPVRFPWLTSAAHRAAADRDRRRALPRPLDA